MIKIKSIWFSYILCLHREWNFLWLIVFVLQDSYYSTVGLFGPLEVVCSVWYCHTSTVNVLEGEKDHCEVPGDTQILLPTGYLFSRLGFLGLLHMEVFNQRLEQEYNMSVILTAPTVPYKAVLSSAKLIKVC